MLHVVNVFLATAIGRVESGVGRAEGAGWGGVEKEPQERR